jgi:hypothetical protein
MTGTCRSGDGLRVRCCAYGDVKVDAAGDLALGAAVAVETVVLVGTRERAGGERERAGGERERAGEEDVGSVDGAPARVLWL